jgi:hypothetical protein
MVASVSQHLRPFREASESLPRHRYGIRADSKN